MYTVFITNLIISLNLIIISFDLIQLLLSFYFIFTIPTKIKKNLHWTPNKRAAIILQQIDYKIWIKSLVVLGSLYFICWLYIIYLFKIYSIFLIWYTLQFISKAHDEANTTYLEWIKNSNYSEHNYFFQKNLETYFNFNKRMGSSLQNNLDFELTLIWDWFILNKNLKLFKYNFLFDFIILSVLFINFVEYNYIIIIVIIFKIIIWFYTAAANITYLDELKIK